jgi:cytochrome c-type biogenesis protein CcmE
MVNNNVVLVLIVVVVVVGAAIIIIIIIIIIEIKYFYQNAQIYVEKQTNKQIYCVHLFIFGNTILFPIINFKKKVYTSCIKMRLFN